MHLLAIGLVGLERRDFGPECFFLAQRRSRMENRPSDRL